MIIIPIENRILKWYPGVTPGIPLILRQAHTWSYLRCHSAPISHDLQAWTKTVLDTERCIVVTQPRHVCDKSWIISGCQVGPKGHPKHPKISDDIEEDISQDISMIFLSNQSISGIICSSYVHHIMSTGPVLSPSPEAINPMPEPLGGVSRDRC